VFFHRCVRPAVVVMMSVASLSATVASAQEAQAQQRRPDQAIFRGDRQGTDSGNVLLLTGSVFESYDDNLVGEQAVGSVTGDPRFQTGGFYSGADAALSYRKRTNRVGFGANGGAALQYYPRLNDLTQSSYHLGTDLSAIRGRRTFQAAQSASWLPYLSLDIVPVEAAAPTLSPAVTDPGTVFSPPLAGNQDLGVFSRSSTSYQTGLGYSQAFGRRSSFGLHYGLIVSDLSTDASDPAGLSNLKSQAGRGTLNVPISRNMTLGSGYGYQDAEYDTSEGEKRTRNHDVDVGLQYLRALSPSRSIGFRVGSGLSVLQRDEDNHPELRGKKYYQALGSAGFTYMFHRTWSATADFRRGLQLFQGLSQPFFANDLGANLSGTFSRRIDFLAGVRYAEGIVGLDTTSRGYSTRTASVRIRYAISRTVALSGAYTYYSYNFSQEAQLPEGIVRELDRQVVRAGLTFGIPLVRRP
jgi:hypothetical protein